MPGPGGPVGYQYPSSAQSDPKPPSLMSEIGAKEKGLTEGQLMNPTAQLISQLAGYFGGLSPSDYQKALSDKSLKGTTLSSDIAQALTGEPTSQIISASHPWAAAAQPTINLDLGSLFQHTLAPFLEATTAMSNNTLNSLAGGMAQALQSGSPQMRSAMAGVPQELNFAEQFSNKTAEQSAASAPYMDAMLQTLVQAIQQQKLTQATAQAEPLVAATYSGGALPSTGAYGQSQSALQRAIAATMIGK